MSISLMAALSRAIREALMARAAEGGTLRDLSDADLRDAAQILDAFGADVETELERRGK